MVRSGTVCSALDKGSGVCLLVGFLGWCSLALPAVCIRSVTAPAGDQEGGFNSAKGQPPAFCHRCRLCPCFLGSGSSLVAQCASLSRERGSPPPSSCQQEVKGFPHFLAQGRVEQGVLADFCTLFPQGRAVLAGKDCRLLALCSLPPGAEGRQAVCRAASSEPRVSQAALSPAAGFDVIYRRDQLRHPGC